MPSNSRTARWHRLLLIPAWFVAQLVWKSFQQGSFLGGMEAMTSLESLWFSLVVVVVVVLYANNYQLVFGKDTKQQQKPGAPEK